MPGKDIFLSYASEERTRILPLVRALERTGWSVFWDVEGIRGGKDWRNVLQEAATSSRCVIVVWSRLSVDRPFVRDEAEEGRKRNVLVPVRIDAVQPPLGFRGTQYRDLSGWDGTTSAPAYRELVLDLTALLGEPVPGSKKVAIALELAGKARDEAERTAREVERIREELESKRLVEARRRAESPLAARSRWLGPVAAAAAVVLVTASVVLRSGRSAGPKVVIATPLATPAPVAATAGPRPPTPAPSLVPATPTPPPVLATPMPVRTAQDWYREGNRRFEARDFEAALSSYTEAIRLNPEYAAAYSYRGGVRRIKGNLGGALEDYNEAIRLKPHLADTYYRRGVLREEMADYRAAAEDLQRYLDLGGALVGVERAEVEARIRRLRQR